MTNQVQEIGQYIQTLAPETAWYEHEGMLGLGLFGSLVATIVVFHIIGFCIAMYHNKKHRGKLLPLLWVKEIFRGGSIWGEAVLGKPTPRAGSFSGDSRFLPVSVAALLQSLAEVRTFMGEIGATLQAYKHRSFDCEDYAMLMKSLITFDLSKKGTHDTYGIPVGIAGYTRDSDGAGHVVCFCDTVEWGRKYFEPYPEKPGFKELSHSEINSIDSIVI